MSNLVNPIQILFRCSEETKNLVALAAEISGLTVAAIARRGTEKEAKKIIQDAEREAENENPAQ